MKNLHQLNTDGVWNYSRYRISDESPQYLAKTAMDGGRNEVHPVQKRITQSR